MDIICCNGIYRSSSICIIFKQCLCCKLPSTIDQKKNCIVNIYIWFTYDINMQSLNLKIKMLLYLLMTSLTPANIKNMITLLDSTNGDKTFLELFNYFKMVFP